MSNITFNSGSDFVKIKNRKIEINTGKEETDDSPIELKINTAAKNIITTMLFKGNKSDRVPEEIVFFFRFIDMNNYSSFSIKSGNQIRFTCMTGGKISLRTDYIQISKDNLFTEKFNLAFSVFEENLTVLIDGVMITCIDHVMDEKGDFFIQIIPYKNSFLNFKLEQVSVSQEILSFEPIINMKKNPAAFFMLANDLYERNSYDLALYYYKKGVLYGKGDDKIYNRIGNIQFLIENYASAEFYYKQAMDENSGNIEYRINYTRSLIKQNKSELFMPLVEDFINNINYNEELIIDYAGYIIGKRDWYKAKEILELIKEKSSDNPAYKARYGRVLIEMGNITEGRSFILTASSDMAVNDPASALILLKYSLDKSPNLEALKLTSDILYRAEEYGELCSLLTNFEQEVEFDEDLNNLYIRMLSKNGLYATVYSMITKMDNPSYDLLALKAESSIELKKYDEAEELINLLYSKAEFADKQINFLAVLIFRLAGFIKREPACMNDIYRNADKNDNSYQDVQKEYAKLLVDLMEFERAIPIVEDLLKIFPEDLELQYNAGIALDGIGDYYAAVHYLGKVYNLTGDSKAAYIYAHSLYYTKSFNNALDILLKHYSSLSKDGEADNLIANIYLSLGNIYEAQRYYYLALEKDEDNEEYALNLAESFYKQSDYESAYKITSQIIKANVFDRAMTLHLKIKESIAFSQGNIDGL